MFITAKLAFEHYIPEQITRGMWFKQRIKDVIYGKIYEYDRIFEMNTLSQESFNSFVEVNGYPVRPRIMSWTANPDEPADTLATYDKIGWWDDGPEFENLRDVELKDLNVVLSDFNGEIQIDVEEATVISSDGTGDEDVLVPIIYADKVTIRFVMEEEYEDDYEDMDWEDDEPEEDSAGHTIHDRYNPEDYETE